MAAKGIKGITIEIGGNTEPLQKSLKDVNSKSASLKTELRDVERLLKLDPTNTTLLAQKQELLGKSIGVARDKLESLKSVQEQVKQKFASGEIDEGQYRAFERELVKTEQQLGEVKQQADKAGDEVEKAGKQADKAGDDAEKGKGKWEKFGSSMKKVGEIASASIAALGAGAAAAGGAVVKMTVDAAYAADDLNTLSKQTGISTEQLQKFQYASDTIDVSMDTLTGSMTKLTKNMAKAKDGSSGAQKAFAELGVSITDEAGNLRDNEDVFADAIESLGKIENEAERDALAMELFGKSAQDLNPLILGGADSLKELGQQAEDAGLILSQDALDSLNTLSDAMDRGKATTTALGNLFGTAFAEPFADAVNLFSDYAERLGQAFNEGGVSQLAEEIGTVFGDIIAEINKMLPEFIDMGLKIIGKLGEGILENAPQIAGTAIQIVAQLTTAILEALPAVAQAAIEVMTAIANGISEQLPILIPLIVESLMSVAQTIVENLPVFLDALLQLYSGIAMGLIEALPTIIEALPEIITGVIEALVTFIPQLIECGIALFLALVENLDEIITGIVEALPEIITAIVDGLAELIPKIVECGIKLFVSLIENLPAIIAGIIKAIPQIITSIINAVKNLFSKIAQVGKELFTQLIAKSGEYTAEIVRSAAELITKLIDKIKGFFTSFADVGKNLVDGLWEGIKSGWNWLMDRVKELAGNLIGVVKKVLGINSPSTVMRDEIGKMMAQGIAVGFEADAPKAFKRINNSMAEQESKMAAAAQTTNNTVNNMALGGINVYFTGSVGSVAEARIIGDTVGDRIRQQLRYRGVLQNA